MSIKRQFQVSKILPEDYKVVGRDGIVHGWDNRPRDPTESVCIEEREGERGGGQDKK